MMYLYYLRRKMMKKNIFLRFGLAAMLVLLIPAFLSAGGGNQSSSSQSSSAASYQDAPLAAITPVPKLPFPPKIIPASTYAYDDLSKATTIEFLSYNYGVLNSNPDPIAVYLGKKYNAKITYTTVQSQDLETTISTRFAAGDIPDVMVLGTGDANRQITQLLFDQGLLVDATQAMKYMPNYAQYFTQDYANYISYKGAYTAAPRYPIQGDWNPFLRKDWLAKLGMQTPKNLDELLTYARRVTNEDPDGNGRKDTWFAGAAGGGQGFGMLENLLWYFGENQYNVKNGKINHPMIDGTWKAFLTFVKTLNDEGLLAPDWYTVDWESFKSYSLNGRVGYVNYPVWNILQEQAIALGIEAKPSDHSWDVWAPLAPIGTGKISPPPGPALMYAFSAKLLSDPVKFKRVCHILDNSLYAGEDYFETIQGGGDKVFGKKVFIVQKNTDGSAFFDVDRTAHPTWTGELDTTGLANAGWQNIGLTYSPYMLSFFPGNDYFNDVHAKYSAEIAGYARWGINFTAKPDPDVVADLTEFQRVELPKFVLGGRNLSNWDAFVKEWLDKGGRKALATTAQQMGAANFE
jgi:ABC-type glycerol-3-phosphate transport system substrate-binding protein